MKREHILLAVCSLIVLLSFLHHYDDLGNTIIHEYPEHCRSADCNSRVSEAEGFEQSKQAYLAPQWFDYSGEKIVAIEPPAILILPAIVSQLSGIEVYDLLFFFTALTAALAAIGFLLYFTHNNMLRAGILAGLLLIYPLQKSYEYMINMGHYPHYAVIVCYPLGLLLTHRLLTKDRKEITAGLLAFVTAVQFYLYAVYGFMFAFFIGAYLLYHVIRKKLSLKHLLIYSIAFWMLILPYGQVLYVNYLGGDLDTSEIRGTSTFSNHPIQLSNIVIPILWPFLLLGLFVSARKKNMLFWWFAFNIFTIFILPHLGVSQANLQSKGRYLFWVMAYPLVAMGLASATQLLPRKIFRNAAFIGIALLLTILHIGNISAHEPARGGVSDAEDYEMYKWLRANTPENASVLCIGCYQFELLHSHRLSFLPAWETSELAQKQLANLSTGQPQEVIWSEPLGWTDNRLYRDGIWMKTVGMREFANREFCGFDYYTFKTPSPLPAQAILAIFSRMQDKNEIVHVQSNPNTDGQLKVVLRNDGGECI